jgi:hypothetical protein
VSPVRYELGFYIPEGGVLLVMNLLSWIQRVKPSTAHDLENNLCLILLTATGTAAYSPHTS